MLKDLRPVFRGEMQEATLVMSYLMGDEIEVKMIQDVTSEPLQGKVAHETKSQYTLQVLLVPPEQEERARELIDDFLERQGDEEK
ncbi:MAG: hypothetical protein R6V10_13995 [bacterium]